MALGGVWSTLEGAVIGGAIGIATSEVASPVLEVERQEAWQANAFRVLDPGSLARLVAEGIAAQDAAAEQASRSGFNANKLAALVQLALRAPSPDAALDMLRRAHITDDQLTHAFRKAGLEPQWDAAYREALFLPIASADLAAGIQQGFVPNDGILPVAPSTAAGNVPTLPPLTIDPVAEAAKTGVSRDWLALRARLDGLPPGPETLLEMWRRAIIVESDVDRGIAQGHTKTEWVAAYKALKVPVLSPYEAAGLRLRGWITAQESYDLGALTGYSQAQMDHLWQNRGRPMTPHQMWLAIRRSNATQADFDAAILRSDIRPEYQGWLWDTRFAYPSPFFIRNAVQHGGMTTARAAVILGYQGWEEQDIASVSASFGGEAGAASKAETATEWLTEYEGLFVDRPTLIAQLEALGYPAAVATHKAELADARRVRAGRDAAIAALMHSYLDHEVTDAQAATELDGLQIAPAARDNLLRLWATQRRVTVKGLTKAQIKKAYTKGVFDQPTAMQRLVDLAEPAADAAVYLAE